MLKCSECKKHIVEETKYMDWLAIFHFFEFLFHENYIEQVTYESMMDRLQTFKKFCFPEKEDEICDTNVEDTNVEEMP